MSHMNVRPRGSSRYHNTCESLRPLIVCARILLRYDYG
jgi:hypothetical protein